MTVYTHYSCHGPTSTAIYTLSLHDALPICETLRTIGRPHEVTDAPDAKPLIGLGGAIEFENVDFVYGDGHRVLRSEEHTSELQSRRDLVCRLLLEKKKITNSSVILKLRIVS